MHACKEVNKLNGNITKNVICRKFDLYKLLFQYFFGENNVCVP